MTQKLLASLPTADAARADQEAETEVAEILARRRGLGPGPELQAEVAAQRERLGRACQDAEIPTLTALFDERRQRTLCVLLAAYAGQLASGEGKASVRGKKPGSV